MKGVLEGIRVLELGNFISGPYGACLLADMGAEVIKVENPKGGDPFRGWDLGGDQPNFWAFNRGKKSVTLNLQTPEGKEIFYGLIKEADVVMENYRPGVTKKLGIDYETLRAINERIVYCSITGTGPTGPYVSRPAYDTVGQGLGGMLSVLMDPKNPRPIGPAYADSLSGLFSAIGVLGALVAFHMFRVPLRKGGVPGGPGAAVLVLLSFTAGFAATTSASTRARHGCLRSFSSRSSRRHTLASTSSGTGMAATPSSAAR